MINMILDYLPILGISIIINIMLGTYYNIEMIKEIFSLHKLISGIVKATIVTISFIGLAYCFDATGAIIDIGIMELTPEMIMTSAISIYMVKDTIKLANILGIPNIKKEDYNA